MNSAERYSDAAHPLVDHSKERWTKANIANKLWDIIANLNARSWDGPKFTRDTIAEQIKWLAHEIQPPSYYPDATPTPAPSTKNEVLEEAVRAVMSKATHANASPMDAILAIRELKEPSL